MEWEPSESDKAWTRNLAESLNNDGVWMVPANGSIWRIYRDDHRAELTHKGFDQELTDRIAKSFHSIGYSVKV